MKVPFQKLSPDAETPRYGSPGAAGADLFALCPGGCEIRPGETVLISTGIAVALPEGTVGLVYARSGLASREGLAPANKVGVIDCDYRGEIKVALHNHSGETRRVDHGERIAQLVVTPFYRAEFSEEDLTETERGAGGFGSTGKR